MDRKKLWQRLVCWLLVLSLWAGNLPLAAVAAEVTGPETVTEETVLPEETAAAEETVTLEETIAPEHPAVQSDEGITFLWETENNDTPANANAFGNHYALRGELSETDQEDWYRFTIGVRSSVATKASSHSDSLLYSLLDSTGETVLGTCKTVGLAAGGYLYYLNVEINKLTK